MGRFVHTKELSAPRLSAPKEVQMNFCCLFNKSDLSCDTHGLCRQLMPLKLHVSQASRCSRMIVFFQSTEHGAEQTYPFVSEPRASGAATNFWRLPSQNGNTQTVLDEPKQLPPNGKQECRCQDSQKILHFSQNVSNRQTCVQRLTTQLRGRGREGVPDTQISFVIQ